MKRKSARRVANDILTLINIQKQLDTVEIGDKTLVKISIPKEQNGRYQAFNHFAKSVKEDFEFVVKDGNEELSLYYQEFNEKENYILLSLEPLRDKKVTIPENPASNK